MYMCKFCTKVFELKTKDAAKCCIFDSDTSD